MMWLQAGHPGCAPVGDLQNDRVTSHDRAKDGEEEFNGGRQLVNSAVQCPKG